MLGYLHKYTLFVISASGSTGVRLYTMRVVGSLDRVTHTKSIHVQMELELELDQPPYSPYAAAQRYNGTKRRKGPDFLDPTGRACLAVAVLNLKRLIRYPHGDRGDVGSGVGRVGGGKWEWEKRKRKT